MSRQSIVFILTVVICLGVGFWAGSTFQQLQNLGRSLKAFDASQDAATTAPRFADEQPATMRRSLWPENVDVDTPDFALILTAHATGDRPVLIEDGATLRDHALTASVTYEPMDPGQVIAVALFTLGQGLANFHDYAHLVHDGAVIDTVTCWRCDVTAADFQGDRLTALINAGRPVTRKIDRFDAEDAFATAHEKAMEDPSILVDTTKMTGPQGAGDSRYWVLTTWRSDER
ncbi:MAG: hypothetical protein AAFZ04_00170 [Pseudomonadota bacterium]